MVTASVFYHLLNSLNVSIDVREVCVFLAPFFSSLTAIMTYLLTSELHSVGAGLTAAGMIAIVPGYISRSVAGSYDNEVDFMAIFYPFHCNIIVSFDFPYFYLSIDFQGIAIFCMLFTYYLWIKSVKTGNIYWAALCSVAYFYMVSSWGGYVFLINIIPIHVFVLMCAGRSVKLK